MIINTRQRLTILGLIGTLILLACVPQDSAPARKPKAIFIIVDGISADTIESVSTPNLDTIAGERGYTRAYVGGALGTESESPTVSAVGYNSLLTGTWANKHNIWDNAANEPDYSYWDIFRVAKNHEPSLQTAIFSTWQDNRTKLLGDGLEAAGGKKLDIVFDGYELDTEQFPHDVATAYIRDIDEVVTAEAASSIGRDGPDLSWVYLQYTDNVGHFLGDSPEMNAAVELMDKQVGRIWSAIEKRQQTHREDWLLLVTTDHGRDMESGRSHGGQSERERTTWIVTNSDALNSHFSAQPAIVDILPSLATHLKLQIPENIAEQLDGRSFVD